MLASVGKFINQTDFADQRKPAVRYYLMSIALQEIETTSQDAVDRRSIRHPTFAPEGLNMYARISALVITGIATAMAAGCCCDPVGYGCVDGYGCDDGYSRVVPYGPLQGLNQLRKRMVCGSGCGEVYLGEWRSTPPDACDPCCGPDWVGGAVPCEPFCFRWRPGALLGALYGKRFCGECGEHFGDCACLEPAVGCDCGGEVIGPEMGGVMTPAADCGCAGTMPAQRPGQVYSPMAPMARGSRPVMMPPQRQAQRDARPTLMRADSGNQRRSSYPQTRRR